MKKTFLLLVLLVGLSLTMKAQESALGIRCGYGGEISYLHPMGGDNRLEADLGLWSHGVDATAIYDWVFKDWPLNFDGNFHWFTGVGGTLGLHNNASLGLAGNIGVEYNFNIPLQLSLDYRPVFYFGSDGFWGDGVALGVRYVF
jgi:hypothetical protein